MPVYEIITKDGCIYCEKAKDILTKKHLLYKTTKLIPDTDEYAIKRDQLIQETGQTTFPWVFKDGHFIGGFTELNRYLTMFDAEF